MEATSRSSPTAGERVFLSRSPEATEALAEELGRALAPGAVLALGGDLGAGKTTFVRGLARGLGVDEPVTSPSYTLMQQYSGRCELFHFDAWMEGRERAFLEGGGAEWFRQDGVAVVEWAERVSEFLPSPRLEVRLEHRGPELRRIRLSPSGPGDLEPLRTALGALRGGPELEEEG